MRNNTSLTTSLVDNDDDDDRRQRQRQEATAKQNERKKTPQVSYLAFFLLGKFQTSTIPWLGWPIYL